MSTQTDESYFPTWTLGWRLRRAIEHAGMTTDELAVRLDVSRSTISRWCNDRGAPPKSLYLSAIAQTCHVDPAWLRTGEQPTGPTHDDGIAPHARGESQALNGRRNPQATVTELRTRRHDQPNRRAA